MKSINHHAPVTCSKTITINASPARVWAVLTDIDQWAAWNPDIVNPKLTGELKPGTTFDWISGGARIRSTLHTVEPFRYFGWTGKSMGTYVIHNWTLNEETGKTEVVVDESMEGFLVSLFRGPFNKMIEGAMQRDLVNMKKECEK